jgi:putative acetyltransferase
VAIEVRAVESPEDIAQARRLFEEYAASLGFSLCFQNFDEEVATLPGTYAPPAGRLVLACCDGEAAGCGALRPLELGVCEMKRVYVRSDFRGRGLGRALTARLIAEARAIGYDRMRLDTLPQHMPQANRMYRALGFYDIPAYYDNPHPGASYLELRLG